MGTSRNNHPVNASNNLIVKISSVCLVYVCSALIAVHEHRVMKILDSEMNQANRVISTGKLHMLPYFHTQPINVVVYNDSQGSSSIEGGFPLRCFQRLSCPFIATLQCHWRDNSSTRGMSTPVLSYCLLYTSPSPRD